MAQKNVLGKGLSAILQDPLTDTGIKTPSTKCGIEELRPNRYQPRKNFNDSNQKQLIDSVKKSGIIQPIVVRKLASEYEIIAGERRWRAAQAAGLRDVPIVIREATDMETAELSLIENIQREELNPLEEADAYVTLIEKFKISQEDVSSKVGKDRSTIANTMRLLKLPSAAKTALIEKKITSGHARCLLSLSSAEEQIKILNSILKKEMSVRETERLVQRTKKQSIENKPEAKDRYLSDLERTLAKNLLAKIQIKGTAKKGLIEIQYTSMDELNRIARVLLDDRN